MHAQLQSLGTQGRGRKAVFAVVDKPAAGGEDLAKSAAAEGGLTPQAFLAKSHAAFDAKKLTGLELSTIDVCVRSNTPIDPALIQKVALAG
jgi:hypothetical protein